MHARAHEYLNNLSAGYRYAYNIQIACLFGRDKLQFIYEYSIQKLDFTYGFLEICYSYITVTTHHLVVNGVFIDFHWIIALWGPEWFQINLKELRYEFHVEQFTIEL